MNIPNLDKSPDYVGREKTKKPAKKLDRLTRDVLAAQEAGMSYGQYKARHPHTPDEDDEPTPDTGENVRTCAHCGLKFQVSPMQTNKLYCSDECRIKHNTEKAASRRKNQPGTIAVCPICGTSFQVDNACKVYCGRKCSAIANRQKSKEYNERYRSKKEAEKNGSN